MSSFTQHERGITIAFQVQPRASKTGIAGEQDGWLRLRVAAPPVDGAANSEIVAWLSKQLRVPKGDVEFLSGERGRKKVVLVHGVTMQQVRDGLGL